MKTITSKKKKQVSIPLRCDYCKYRGEEHKKLGFMWYCEKVNHYVVFGQRRCEAAKSGIPQYEFDENKYRIWEKKNKQ